MAKATSKGETAPSKKAGVAPTGAKAPVEGEGTRASPWTLQTPSHASEFVAFRDDQLDPPALVVQVGKTELRYHLRCIDDLRAMLVAHGDWMALGSADEQHFVALDHRQCPHVARLVPSDMRADVHGSNGCIAYPGTKFAAASYSNLSVRGNNDRI